MKKNKLFIAFLVIIYGLFLLSVSKIILVRLNIIQVNSFDNDQVYISKEENNIIDKLNNFVGSKKIVLENKITNCFPFYIGINSLYQKINYSLDSIIYNNDVPIKKDSDGNYIFYNKMYNFYYMESEYDDINLNERVNTQIEFFNNLKKTGANIYIYIPTNYNLTNLKEMNLNKYIELFKDGIDDDINISVMDVPDIETYLKFFYRTDHHWTMAGAISGYNDIIKMMGKEPLTELNLVFNKERKYYGSIAKKSLNDQVNDYISDIDLHLDYDVLVNGKEPDNLFKPRYIRLDRSYKYYDYYVQYFNGQYGNIIYDYHDDSKDNLLIMSDSFAWQIDYLIAASFNKTHVINLRYDEYKNKNFDLSSYIKDNNINNVLFLYDGESIIFNSNNYNFKGVK